MAYEYGAKEPEKLKIKDMTAREKELLLDSETFCILPWMHLHAYPDGRAYPCCFGFDPYPVGNLNKDSMETVFNNDKMKTLRKNMLAGVKSKICCTTLSFCVIEESRRSSNALPNPHAQHRPFLIHQT